MSEQGELVLPGVAEAPLTGLLDFRCDPCAEIRDRLSVYGPSALDEDDTLVLLLERCFSPGANLADAAAALMARFGAIGHVFGAPEPELALVIGVPAARQLGMLHGLLLRVLDHPLRKRDVLSSFSAVSTYLRARMTGLPREEFRVLFLDKRNQLIADEQMGSGSIDHCPVYPREVMRRALELNCAAILLSHNHPSCDPTPSSADIAMTKQIVAAGEVMKIAVHDHMIVAGDLVVSLRAQGLM